MSDHGVIATDRAPGAIGPYSQAVRSGDLVFCSGQIPLDPMTGQLVEGGIGSQTTRTPLLSVWTAGVMLQPSAKART